MIFICIALYLTLFYVPDGIIYGLNIEAFIVCMTLSAFLKTDYNKPKEKSSWFCLSIYTILNALILTWIDNEAFPFIEIVYPFEVILFLAMYFYSKYRSYDIGVDEYNSEDVFIVFKRPKNFLDYLISFIFKPVSSVSIIIAGEKYGFKRGSSFSRTKYRKKDYHSYIKIELNPEAAKKLLLLFLGDKWKLSRNCCHVVQRIFPSHKFGVLDSLPSHMAKTILKIRG